MAGRVLPSERPEHVIYESELVLDSCVVDYADPSSVPNPLGVVGILSAFNFPVSQSIPKTSFARSY